MSANAFSQLLEEFRDAAENIPSEGFGVSAYPCITDHAKYEGFKKKSIFLGECMLPFNEENGETGYGLAELWVSSQGAHAQCGIKFAELASRAGAALYSEIKAKLADLWPSHVTKTAPVWFSLLWRIHDDIPIFNYESNQSMVPYLSLIRPFILSADAIVDCKLDTDTPVFPPPGDHWGCRVRKHAVEDELRLLDENELDGVRIYLKDITRPIIRMDFSDSIIADHLQKLLKHNGAVEKSAGSPGAPSSVKRDEATGLPQPGKAGSGSGADGEQADQAELDTPTTKREKQLKWLAEAMLLRHAHPTWSNAKIAKKVKKNPSTLSRNKTYKAAAAMARGDKDDLTKGHVKVDSKTGLQDVEAYSDDPADQDWDD